MLVEASITETKRTKEKSRAQKRREEGEKRKEKTRREDGRGLLRTVKKAEQGRQHQRRQRRFHNGAYRVQET